MYFMEENYKLESCGARLLAPQPCDASLSLAPTRTGPKNIVIFMAPTLDRPDYIMPVLKQFIINPKLTSSRLQ